MQNKVIILPQSFKFKPNSDCTKQKTKSFLFRFFAFFLFWFILDIKYLKTVNSR